MANYWNDAGIDPIAEMRAPTGQDYAGYGTIWIDQSLDDIWVAANTSAGLMVWVPCGGGSGTFSSVTINPGNLTVTAGNLNVAAGTATIGAFGKGLVFSSAAGLLSSSAGTNGQIVIGKTGDSPLWASLASSDGSVGIAVGANTIDLTVTGATGSTFPTDGAIVTPLAGATSIVGDTNITTDGVVPNTVTINLNPSISLTGKITAGNDFEMTTGTCLIASDDNAANAIYLHANGGVNETIHLYSQLGTGVASLNFESLVGGIYVSAGTALSLNAASASVINITNNSFGINTGTGALNLGTDAFAKTVTLGSTAGAASTIVQSGTGALNVTGGGAITISSAGLLKIDSSAGGIDIGTDVVAQNINIGTGASVRTVSIGNSTGASSVVAHCGTGAFDLGVDATDHTTRIGSTSGVSAFTAQAGTGAMTFTAGGAFDVNAVGVVTIDSTGAAISIGNGADAFGINIGTGAAQRNIIIGNATGTTSVVVNGGTGAMQFGANAIAHDVTVGSVTGAANTSILSGTGLLNVASLGSSTYSAVTTLDIDTAGALSINSSAGIINIGNDAVAQNIYIGTGGAARVINIGNDTGATSVVVTGGTGAMQFGANAIAHAVTVGSTTGAAATTVQSGSGGLALNSAGLLSTQAGTDTQAGAGVTINTNVGYGIFTGLTTAAAATEVLTVTNSLCTANSVILCSLSNFGANDAKMTVGRVIPGAGSFTVSAINNGAAALNGNIVLAFWILKV